MIPYGYHIWYHMPDVTKTTVYLDEADSRRLKAMARGRGRSTAELVREAVAEYARRHAAGFAMPRSVAIVVGLGLRFLG